jgi:CHAD domain-containing protein
VADRSGMTAPRPSADQPVATAIGAVLADDVERLLATEAAARAGDSEGVRLMRRAARRLRSTLRLFGPWLDRLWARGLADDLRRLGRALGGVRDLDVFTARLAELADDETARRILSDHLQERQCAARDGLAELLHPTRFEALRRTLEGAARSPWCRGDIDEPCRAALPRRIRKLWKPVRRLGRSLGPETTDEEYHELRKRGKDLRFASLAAVPWIGRRRGVAARRFAGRLSRLLDALGARQDAVTATGLLEPLADGLPDGSPEREALARWRSDQRKVRREASRAAADAWRALDRRKRVAWMKP